MPWPDILEILQAEVSDHADRIKAAILARLSGERLTIPPRKQISQSELNQAMQGTA